ncbi:PQQ-binding-like beta-propeller repeat protein [Gillisia sp. M10.2A]|uniref:PQQ-binding-like beta-propeller repeat protein n=1 Tax=Gillisia lutea TaxID=2909668 RepID=A0ABS9EFP5_9FLAO|nr:PQQ-binding-like beta-propeller repeat protein [Gillisia lutea]MCF4100605.1 PQQ-binding-like beta-propeller repeat protein [Gillisia lutea]
MKKLFFLSSIFYLFVLNVTLAQEFKFAFVSDTHIGTETAAEDLERTVVDINNQNDIEFVVLTGDITEMGTDIELAEAKKLLDKLDAPYYIVPGNHDTGWSESGGVSFIKEFGYDKFVFEHKGYKFIGCASGPYVRMSDGHIPRDAVVWLDEVLNQTPKDQPIVFVNHYPLDNSLDNWYEVIDRLKEYNTQFAICGHGHRNKAMDFEGIPATMSRSNLRAKDTIGGYNIVEVTPKIASFKERIPGKETLPVWRSIDLGNRTFSKNIDFERPTYAVNDSFPEVKKIWSYHSNANVISTPANTKDLVIFGNSTGLIEALSIKTSEKVWNYKTEGGIFSSPSIYKNTVILGSGDGYIYCLNSTDGSLVWKTKTEKSVLGSPLINNGIIYIGGSDGKFRALDANTGKEIWNFSELNGPVVSTPLIHNGKVIFGAWDKNLYALYLEDGSLAWKWSNGSANRMFSPAMVIPVAFDDVIYIVAPDRYISAINATSGETLWRSNEATVRESIGISEDNSLIYGKTMNDEIVAFKTGKNKAELAWRKDFGFGYEHVPSMLIEKGKSLYFGTKNGVVYSIDPTTQTHNWSYKIDNSMVNTVNVLDEHQLVAATMDGKIVMLSW